MDFRHFLYNIYHVIKMRWRLVAGVSQTQFFYSAASLEFHAAVVQVTTTC